MKSDQQTFIFFDTETNGFSCLDMFSEYHRIIQLAATDTTGRHVFDRIINPEVDIHKESTKIHRITRERTLCEETFESVYRKFVNYLAQFENVVLVAHNCFGFDKIMMEKEITRCGLGQLQGVEWCDSLPMFRKHFSSLSQIPPRNRPFNLGNLHKYFFGHGIKDAHNALADIGALRVLFSQKLSDKYDRNTDCFNGTVTIPDSAPLTELRYFGDKRRCMANAFFGQDCVVGTLRKFATRKGNACLELFLRDRCKMDSDSQIISVISQVTSVPVLQVAQQFPFVAYHYGLLNNYITAPVACRIAKAPYHVRTFSQLISHCLIYDVSTDDLITTLVFTNDVHKAGFKQFVHRKIGRFLSH